MSLKDIYDMWVNKLGLQEERVVKMRYRRNEKFQDLMNRRVNCKNTESIVEIFINTMKSVDMYNAVDVYFTLHIISVWSVKNLKAREFPCMTAKIVKIMDTLYDEIRWKSDKKLRRLTPSMVFIHFGVPCSLKEIYEMYENDQDDYYNLIILRVNRFNDFLLDRI